MKPFLVSAFLVSSTAFGFWGEVKEIGYPNLISFHNAQNATCTPAEHGALFRNRAWTYVSYSDGPAQRWLALPLDSDSWKDCAEAKRQTAMGLAYRSSNFHSILSGYVSPTAYGCEEKFIVATLGDTFTFSSDEKGDYANFVYSSKATHCP